MSMSSCDPIRLNSSMQQKHHARHHNTDINGLLHNTVIWVQRMKRANLHANANAFSICISFLSDGGLFCCCWCCSIHWILVILDACSCKNGRTREKNFRPYAFFLATNTFSEMNVEKKLWYAVIFSVLYIYPSGFEAFTSLSSNSKTNASVGGHRKSNDDRRKKTIQIFP